MMQRRRSCTAALFGAVALVLAGCTVDPAPPVPSPSAPSPSSSSAAPEESSAPLGPQTITTGLAAPWSVAFVGETPLISERDSGRILEIDAAGQVREIGAIDGVVPRGEGGLLGIAVREEHLYAYFTAADGNRIERYALAGQPGSLALGDAETILAGIPSANNHNGGRIAFGPDGMLYVTTGDAGSPQSSQDLDSLAGKILRLTPEGAVPADNPFAGSSVYSYGHRNPQGIAWAEDGTLYSSEFGQNTWDELNVIEPGGNYGWPEAEGIAEIEGYIDPVQQWAPAEASPSGIAIIGGSIYVANLRGARLIEVPLSDLGAMSEHHVGEYGRLRDAVVAPSGALWIVTNNTDGRGSPGPDDDRIIALDPAM